ncbi:MAG: sigma-70 family RNA polymerase sigma factor [Spirochaetota bacterium]
MSHNIDNTKNYTIQSIIVENQELIKKYIYKLMNIYECDSLYEHDISDIQQLVNIKLMTQLHKYRGECKISSYIYYVTRSVFCDYIECNNQTYLSIYENCGEGTETSELVNILADKNLTPIIEILEEQELMQILYAEIEKLNIKTKNIVKMTLDGLTQQEIAQKFNITQATVSEHLSNAKKILKKALTPYYK